jgi:hypothetical protein
MRNLLIPVLAPLEAAATEPWSIGTCASESAAERAALEKAMRSASPDPLYLPHPFPQTMDQAVADLVFAHRRAAGRAAPMREDDARFFEAVDADEARFVVAKVANWTPERCESPFGQTDFHYLIRVFDKASGNEITRASVTEAGRVYQLVHRPADPEQAAFTMSDLPTLSIPKSLQAPQNAQYVQTWGQVQCHALKPCVAFQSGGREYLARGGDLYRLEVEKPISLGRRLGSPEARQEYLATLEGRPERLVSVGGDRVVLAVPINP